jgi:hypothetical protein
LAAKPTGGVGSSYLTDFPHHSRIGGHPQARATLGKRDIGAMGFTINKNRSGGCKNREVEQCCATVYGY